MLHYSTINQIYTQLNICFSLQHTLKYLQQYTLSAFLHTSCTPQTLRKFCVSQNIYKMVIYSRSGQIPLSAGNQYLLQVTDYSVTFTRMDP